MATLTDTHAFSGCSRWTIDATMHFDFLSRFLFAELWWTPRMLRSHALGWTRVSPASASPWRHPSD